MYEEKNVSYQIR